MDYKVKSKPVIKITMTVEEARDLRSQFALSGGFDFGSTVDLFDDVLLTAILDAEEV